MDRHDAEKKLKQIFKLDDFYPEQWLTIEKLFRGERLLLIEKTGFGKSLCYQFPATQFPGITIIFSPLIALMRDQVAYLQSLDIAADCINSEMDKNDVEIILKKAKAGNIKILYIAPERHENKEWAETVHQLNISMVVIDEAHCISVWGHDFRPAFRRIVNVVRLLPRHFPILATTATATPDVAKDIIQQMQGEASIIRGNLLRSNFQLQVIQVKNESQKMIWLAEFLLNEAGAGLVYTGTRVNTELYARWLRYVGISAIHYNAGLGAEKRKEIEYGLKTNRWKCIVSTNALGMGIDKPDIRFIVHTQMPASPIHYYQEIGRAGRDGLPTKIILLYNPTDRDLPSHFIENSRPAAQQYKKVIKLLKKEPLGQNDLIKQTNMTSTQIRVILADLIDQNIIQEAVYEKRKKYEYRFRAPRFKTAMFEELRKFKFQELEHMIAYIESKKCRMNYLRNYLGDTTLDKCGLCDNDLNQHIIPQVTPKWRDLIWAFYDEFFPELGVASKRTNLVNGVAAAYYGTSQVGTLIHRSKYENGGDFPDELVQKTVRAYRSYFQDTRFDLIVYVPPTESGDLVKNFAEKIANIIQLPISHGLKKARETNPQKVFQNFVLKRENVKHAFKYQNPDELEGKSILLIDDILDSGATIKEIGRALTMCGAKKIAPLVIAKTTNRSTADSHK